MTGNFLSNVGLHMLSVAVSWDLYQQTRSAAVLGNVGFAQVTPFLLFALVAGHYADRYDRRSLMLSTQALVVASSALLVFSGSSVAMIFLCLFLNATGRTFQGPARLSILPSVVSPQDLRTAITWNSSSNEIATISGPALAGLMLAFTGSHTVYVMQLVCAMATLGCYWMLEPSPPKVTTTTSDGDRSVLEGLRFVWRTPLIFPAVSLDMFAVLFGGATALLPIYAVEILHTDAQGLGWLRAAPAIGAVSMALFSAHRLKIVNAGRTLLLAVAGFGVAMIGFGISRNFWLSFALLIVTGAMDNISVVLRQSLVQSSAPDHMRGRVLAVNSIFISCSNQLGAVESGWAAALMGTVPGVVFGGVATILIAGIWGTLSKPLRHWRQST